MLYIHFGTLFTQCPMVFGCFTHTLARYLRSVLWIVAALHTVWHAIYVVSYGIRLLYTQLSTLSTQCPMEFVCFTNTLVHYLRSVLWKSCALHTLRHTIYSVSYRILVLDTHFGTLFTQCPMECKCFTHTLARYSRSVVWIVGALHAVCHTIYAVSYGILLVFAVWHAIYAVSYGIRMLYTHFGTLFTQCLMDFGCFTNTLAQYLCSVVWKSCALQTLWHVINRLSIEFWCLAHS